MELPKNELINNENELLFKNVFNKSLIAIHMNFLKHLNRHRKWTGHIPQYVGNKWVPKSRIHFQENSLGFSTEVFTKNHIDVSKLDITKKYTIIWYIIDSSTNICMSLGVCETRNDAFRLYINLMRNAEKLKVMLLGDDKK